MRVFAEDFGALGDGVTLNTQAVQRAVEYCTKKGGGEIVFSRGKYVLSTIFLRSNVHIFLKKDAVLLGSKCFSDYCPDEKADYPLYQDASHSFFHCSLFSAENCENISLTGKGTIDMRSVWDDKNVRNMAHRGAKCIALKNCRNIEIRELRILNATDLAVYFAGCENVKICGLKIRVHIDGISPDNSSNVEILDCDVESGDDGIVFKSSYTLNRLGICKNIVVRNCRIKSRCSAVKFGTESNGGFQNFLIEDIEIRETRITGIAIESVDGAVISGIQIRNVRMKNVGAPFFVHLGNRLRGPEGVKIGSIENVIFENVTAEGPFVPWKAIEWNYQSFLIKDRIQYPYVMDVGRHESDEPFTSNFCGLRNHPLRNVKLKNIFLEVAGGASNFYGSVPERADGYPEVFVYGRTLPARGIYFRYIEGLTLNRVSVHVLMPDERKNFIFENVKGLLWLDEKS